MHTYLDCFPCFLRQALDASRFASNDPEVHETVVCGVLRLAAEMDMRQPPPAIGQQVHRLIRQITGNDDPYRRQKQHSTALALRLYAELKQEVDKASDPVEAAVRVAIAGNILDFGVHSELDYTRAEQVIRASLKDEFDGTELPLFVDSVKEAEGILYLGDNAGEIVFDRLLIELLPRERVTFVVKGAPVINDATMEDAQAGGLTEMVEVIDNGSDGPGTLLSSCSPQFRRRFEQADLIIAKGQGNYESLSDVNKNIFFILKAKCPVIASDLNCPVGEMILRQSRAFAEPFATPDQENTDARI